MIHASTEATMTSLKWMLVYLMHWPEYQVKLLNDILENAQNSSHPYLKNKYNFNFVQEFCPLFLYAHLTKHFQMKKSNLTI